MGAHKICTAVNKRAAHGVAHCDRLWGAVWRFLPAVREVPTRADRAELRAVSEEGRRSRRKPRHFSAPGRLLLPAVRAVSRASRWRFSGRLKRRLTLFSCRRAKKAAVCGFSLTLN